MSRPDFFTKYVAIYQKATSTEVVPDGPFIRQLADLSVSDLSLGVFFKARREKTPKQVYIRQPIPYEVANMEGLLELDSVTYLSRTIISDVKGLQYLRLVLSAGTLLETPEDRYKFLRKCQRVIDTFVRKARNIVHLGVMSPFRCDRKIKTLKEFLESDLKMDDVGVEAAMIPFLVARPEYVVLNDNSILVVGDEPSVAHGTFHLVGGIGYIFDKGVGAIQEERMFRTKADLSVHGFTEAYIDSVLSTITSDFQTNIHSILFSDIWRKSNEKPKAINFGEVLVKAYPESDIWSGVFEMYLRQLPATA
ncbi:MAG: hypothetical protein QXS20_08250 [Candidatus Thorarchaeota archaeon]